MPIDPLYARYPFFEGAREAVREADISPAALVVEDAPAVERGRERVERALMEGTVAAEEPKRWDRREELLSYPIARILVSLVDTPAAVDKYATAEAATARERFEADFGGAEFQSTGRARASLDEVLREFDLDGDVRPDRSDGPGRSGPSSQAGRGGVGPGSGGDAGRTAPHYWVALGPYLELGEESWGSRWRLVNREVRDGEVRVESAELSRLLEAAVERRVSGGLPFEVRGTDGGDAIADALDSAVADLRSLLNDHDAGTEEAIEAVVPALFPPCMKALVQRARSGESVPEHAEFSLVSFLVALGMDGDDVTTLLGVADAESDGDETEEGREESDGDGERPAERIRTRVEYLSDSDGTQYPPPSCATMQSYGTCVDPDERCERISHPLSYYTDALADAGDVRDWREATSGE
ncbi:DNA primase [Halobellus sp. EA9]|uniref:DNA primase n=1 Tax=Halobellus sp. EA9 TaxID=3421647 RepID=UPI003EB7DC42